MTIDWRPWRQLLPVWLPVLVVAVASVGFFFYQTSDSLGRTATLTSDIDQLSAEVERLTRLHGLVTADREEVAAVQDGFQDINERVFADLDRRLTRILRAVGDATRDAGLLPGSYSYTAKEEKGFGYIRFGIAFQVVGEYPQIRKMLASLQSSPEFLIVDGLSLVKAEDPASRELRIGVRMSTYLGEVDPERLRRLTGGIVVAEDDADQEAGNNG
jgi:Tfp pilus assembly protein PilO